VRTRTTSAIVAAAALVLAACGGTTDDIDLGGTTDDTSTDDLDGSTDDLDGTDDVSDDGDATDEPAEALDAGAETTAGLQVASSDLGDHVVDADGRTVYVSTTRGDEDACVGDCAQVWPPVLVDGEPELGDGIDASLVGTVELDDGSTQLTYDDARLHYYRADRAAGEVRSQGLVDEWFVVGPDGAPIGAPEAPGSGTETDADADDDQDA
jgi:predicted lipoprotein with Yx(FWY)xxD motif/predicted small secreted protein